MILGCVLIKTALCMRIYCSHRRSSSCKTGCWGGAECSELIDTTLALPVVFEAYTKKARPDASGVEQDKERIMQLWSLACQYSLHRVLAACESQVFSGLKIKKKKNGKCAACGYHPGEYVAAPVTALDPDQCLSELSGTGLHNAAVSLIKILNNHLKHPIWID